MLTDTADGLRSWLRPNSFGSRRHRDGLDIGGGKHLIVGWFCVRISGGVRAGFPAAAVYR